MAEYRLGEVEMKFADIIWENEPIASGELVKLSGQRLQWKKSTTYTILKRLCEFGHFRHCRAGYGPDVREPDGRHLQDTG